jgi:hypothetical protein
MMGTFVEFGEGAKADDGSHPVPFARRFPRGTASTQTQMSKHAKREVSKDAGLRRPVPVVDRRILCQVHQAEGARYASGAAKGRSSGGTPEGALDSRTCWDAPDLKAVGLGRMHLMFFASQKYLETYGRPWCRNRHIPDYASALGGKIIPLEVELRRRYDIWLSYHPGNGRIPLIQKMIDWLVDTFNPAKFPWFKDEFVHPSEFKGVYSI